MKVRRDGNFMSFFDERNGTYMRTGVIKDGRDTGKDPFMASFPELLDVGIMGHCKHGRSGLCVKAGIECYQNGLYSGSDNMSVEDFAEIARQCKGRTFQFALGGCGDPDQHEHFEKILALCFESGIVPNFTTSGFGMTVRIAELCKKYCGAVAVSWYRSSYTMSAIEMLTHAGVKTNIHYVLNTNTVEEALEHLRWGTFPTSVNAVVFLLHKPVGQGTKDKVITGKNREFGELIRCIDSGEFPYRIGFDSCTVPALVRGCSNVDPDSLDTCEGGRWSAYISPDMKMMPCSFDNQEQRWAVDLRKNSILDAWKSAEFEDFRSRLQNACPNCSLKSQCMGGCPICPEIVLCDERTRTS